MISSKEMVTRLACDLTSDKTCADLEFEGLANGDTVRLEQYSYINVTFHLDTSKCPGTGDSFLIKVSSNEEEHGVSECIIIIKNQNCTIPESNCQCLSETRGWVRMFRQLNVSGQVPIVWRWSERQSKKRQGNASIVFDVFWNFHTENTTTGFQGGGSSVLNQAMVTKSREDYLADNEEESAQQRKTLSPGASF